MNSVHEEIERVVTELCREKIGVKPIAISLSGTDCRLLKRELEYMGQGGGLEPIRGDLIITVSGFQVRILQHNRFGPPEVLTAWYAT